MRLFASLSENKTFQLWQSFRSRQNKINNQKGTDLFSVQIYGEDFVPARFTPEVKFEKWAAVEVRNFEQVPPGMDTYELPGGQYAVFVHRGPVSAFRQTWDRIYTKWLPNSGFKLDNRPHFEILSEKYLGPQHPDSEEEVWIPIVPTKK